MKRFTIWLGIAFTFIFSVNIKAAPITSDHLINIFQISSLEENFSGYSTDTDYLNAYAEGVEAYGSSSLGEVGSIAANYDSGINSVVTMYDTLVFDSFAEVSFSFLWEGTLSKDAQFAGNPYAMGRIDIFDITGLDNWLETSDFFGIPDVSVVDGAPEVSTNLANVQMDQTTISQSSVGAPVVITTNLATDGTEHEVSYELSDTIEVDPSKKYGIRLLANAYSGGLGSSANFLSTGAFNFTDLGGASYTSGSGQFLSKNSPVDVPEPRSAGLLLIGLACFYAMSRLKMASSSAVISIA